MSVRFYLKEKTESRHRRLDEKMSALRLDQRTDYLAFLNIHAAVLLPLEEKLRSDAAYGGVPDAQARLRGGALRGDLAALQAPLPAEFPAPAGSGWDRVAGWCYVAEGSRLGARLLVQRVGTGLPVAFLAHGAEDRFWRGFLGWLEARPWTPQTREAAASAACDVFDCYLAALDAAA